MAVYFTLMVISRVVLNCIINCKKIVIIPCVLQTEFITKSTYRHNQFTTQLRDDRDIDTLGNTLTSRKWGKHDT